MYPDYSVFGIFSGLLPLLLEPDACKGDILLKSAIPTASSYSGNTALGTELTKLSSQLNPADTKGSDMQNKQSDIQSDIRSSNQSDINHSRDFYPDNEAKNNDDNQTNGKSKMSKSNVNDVSEDNNQDTTNRGIDFKRY